MRYLSIILYSLIFVLNFEQCFTKVNSKKLVVDNISDIKDFKKLLRTKTNVLVCFYNKPSSNIVKMLKEVAETVKGEGTIALVDCAGEAKKMCKKLKIQSNEPWILKHYKDGDFNKDYNRKLAVTSIVHFMRDPTGDIPWEEDDSADDVLHIPDANTLVKLIKKEPRPILIMFYAPWCGYCKTLKPEYLEAAKELKDEAVLGAIDVNRPENTGIRSQFNITGFPTLLYFENGIVKYTYDGENKKDAIVAYMRNPSAAPMKRKENEWSDIDSDVVHLTAANFDPVIKEEASVLVMFYAPWCGHCKKMKPEYENAAAIIKGEGIPGMLAAIDATKEPSIAAQYNVKGYPTIMYFSFGVQQYDVNLREAHKIIDFMRDPKEPPPPPPPEKPWSEEKSDVVHLDEDVFKPFLKKKKHVLVIFYAPWCGHCKRAKPEFTQAAAIFKEDPKVEFAAVDCTAHPTLCTANDVKGYPTIKYLSYYNKVTKIYHGGRTKDDFVKFMSDPEASVPTPTPVSWNRESAVLHLNDKNFEAEMKKKDLVLVMFYAPWCGYCKKMKPDYVAAAKELESEGLKERLAMVDCTENPHLMEAYKIEGFPTIKLFRNGEFVKDYTGKRTANDIKMFVRQYMNGKDEL